MIKFPKIKFDVALLLLALGAFTAGSHSFGEELFQHANGRGVTSETGNLNLATQGYVSRPYYNDYAGATDKYLTHAAKFGLLKTWSDILSSEFDLYWRFITPNLWDPLDLGEVSSQNAPFADWLSLSQTTRLLTNFASVNYIQVELEAGSFGNFGAKKFQRAMHGTIRNTTQAKIERNEYWIDTPNHPAMVLGIEAGKTINQNKEKSEAFNLAFGASFSPLTNDIYGLLEYINNVTVGRHWSLEARIARQFNSTIYKKPLVPFRVELAMGWKFRTWLTPTLKIISPIFKNDDRPQIYVDPLVFNCNF